MKQFPLAKYVSTTEMYAAKADYYEKLAYKLLEALYNHRAVRLNEDGAWVWDCTGELVGQL